jgi:hypothetical protein
MKLSEIKGEEALEVLADIMEPAAVIMADERVLDTIQKEPKIVAAAKIIKWHKKEILTVLAYLNQEDPETFNPSLLALPKMVIDLMNDPEVNDLFQSQGLMTEGESSISASENTTE